MFNFFAIFGGCSYFRLGGERSILLSYRDLYEIELVTITFGFELIG